MAGNAATIQVGTVTTGDSGTPAQVSNSGDSQNAVFDFVIPQGLTGQDGADGQDGQDGMDGATGPTGPTGPTGALYLGKATLATVCKKSARSGT